MANDIALSYITHFYNNLDHARRVAEMLSRISRDTKQLIEVVFIDDGSADFGSIYFGDLNAVYARITRDIPWNQAGARNLGFMLSRGRALFFTDIDHIVDEEGFRHLISKTSDIRDSDMFRFRRRPVGETTDIHSHVNTFLVSRTGYSSVGGYDLEFAGSYGHEDTYLEFVWKKKGGCITELPMPVFHFRGARTSGLDRSTDRNEALLKRKRDGYVGSPLTVQMPNVPWILANRSPDGLSLEF